MTVATLSRNELARKAIVRFVAGFLVLAALLFLPAWTIRYWQAWLYLAVFLVPIVAAASYLLVRDPALLQRRLAMKEKEADQALIQKIGAVCYLATYIVSALDHRLGWSAVPVAAVLLADVTVLLGYALFFRVLQVNSYASRVIGVEAGQRLVTEGPYGVVRHPMYLAILVMYFATPVALGSWWGVLAALPLAGVLAARIAGEERVLIKDLHGYSDYKKATRYRMIPGVW
jgi:protein-S-isoprenylcysteine O-methyltransferase Ste14